MNRGFTLIEMLVSIAIFMVIIVMGTTAVLGIINADKKSQSSTLVISNLSLAVEAMSKSIRVGTGFTSPAAKAIEFTPSSGEGKVEYSFDEDNHAINRTTIDKNGVSYTAAITAPEVYIEDVRFRINDDSGIQPSVLMLIKGHSGVKEGTVTTFYLQSMISQRLITSL